MFNRCAARGLLGALAALLLAACQEQHYSREPNRAYHAASQAHVGRPAVVHPADNPLSVAAYDLGLKLFHDKRLSADGTVSCGTCHNPEQGYTQTGLATPRGVGGQRVRRNAQTLYDVGQRKALFHDGRAASLEEQYLGPLLSRTEMGNASVDEVVSRVRGFEDYQRFFAYAYGSEPSADKIGKALAVYERALVTGPNRFDRWRFGGEGSALSGRQQAGYRLFVGRANCSACHAIGATSAEFTNEQFRRNGYAKMRADAGALDQGRAEVTGRAQDRYAFRIPSLRNVELTRPYMHDGGLATLADVVTFYNTVGLPSIAAEEGREPPSLSDAEQAELVAFLTALTSAQRP
jgi:cytochrome c peroxidase